MKKDQGLVRWIILIVIAVIILGYFGFNVRGAVNSPTTQDNLNFLKDTAVKIWDYVLRAPALWIWEVIILPLIHKFVG
jgi:hypothetical protein